MVSSKICITGDGKFLLLKRPEKGVDYFPGCWSASLEKGLNAPWEGHMPRETLFEESVDSTIVDGVRRGLKEELKLEGTEVNTPIIRVLGIGMERGNLNTCLYCSAEFPSNMTSDLFASRLQSYAEQNRITWFDPTLENARHVLDWKEPPIVLGRAVDLSNWKWHPTSRMRLYMYMCRRLGQDVAQKTL